MKNTQRLLLVEDKIKNGYFRLALEELMKSYNVNAAADQVIRAELLLRTEGAERAQPLARQILESKGIGALVKARASMVLALSLIRTNSPNETLKLLEQSVHLATTADDKDLACRAQIELLVAKFDRFGPAGLGTLPVEVWRSVRSIGDPRLFSMLHCRLGTMEALRGSLDVAKRHVDLASLHLNDHENPYIGCLISNLAANIAVLAANPKEAIARAHEALRLSRLSGDSLNEFAALNNLCQTSIIVGAFDRAEHYLKVADAFANRNALMKICVYDNRAQLQLLSGDVEACEVTVSALESLCDGVDLRSRSYTALETTTTRIRLLQSQRELASAVALAQDAVAAAIARGATPLTAQFSIQCADLFAELGRLDEACGALRVAEEAVSRLSVDSIPIRADLDCVRGKVFGLFGALGPARRFLSRAIRINTVIGYSVARKRALALKASMIGESLSPERRDLNKSVPAAQERENRASALLQDLETVAGLFVFSSRPELLGLEAFELLASARVAVRLTLVVKEGASLIVLKEYASKELDPASESLDISLGRKKSHAYTLRVSPRATPTAQACVAALRAILRAAVANEETRCDNLEKNSLWPIERDADIDASMFASPRMKDLYVRAMRAAETDLTVLLTGATGVGKEVLAREIHRHSLRAQKVFQPIVCSGMPSGLLESQLFGHKKGSFTGAHSDFPGVIRAAEGGTLFLDEIAELSQDLQIKLLRFLESKEIHPIGELHPIHVDVRIIAATNAKLHDMVTDGRFREDLFYRLNVATFNIPSLRERREEIPGLVHHFLAEYSQQNHRPMPKLSDEGLEYLLLYSWPGNVRELRNEMERLAGTIEIGGTIAAADLKHAILSARKTMPANPDPYDFTIRLNQPMQEAIRTLEREMIRRVLSGTNNSLEAAARILGLSRKGLYFKRQRLGL
jgi:DNA-binding NtrC family response regulator/tetratricopeptide (TPR) repeat protein